MIGRMASNLGKIAGPLWRGLVLLFLVVLLTGSLPDHTGEDFVYDRAIRGRYFDFVEWELETLSGKALYSLAPPHSRLVEAYQRQLALEFLGLLEDANYLQQEISTAYSDPAIANPDQVTEDLKHELAQIREHIEHLQPLVEGVLEEQIAAVLVSNGIGAAGRVFPPVQLRFTALPAMLVVSPRDRIESIHFSALDTGLPLDDWIEIEQAVADSLDVSTLVTAIGGLAAYPAMMYESSSIAWIAEAGTHEWTHHYLTLRPLGVLYEASPELRTMNETVASVVGSEIGAEVIRRFYPEFAPPPGQPAESASTQPDDEQPQEFDFRAEMRATRLRVDELLAQGEIKEAEAYMEERRHVFWENGYRIRRLNQAYFAFHGAYADEPGERGEDPVGPAVLQLREQSASLQDFLRQMSRLTSFEELQRLIKD
jgi:hypothetical protein